MQQKKYKQAQRKSVGVNEPPAQYSHSSSEGPLTFEKVWLMFQESQKKIDKGFLETKQMFDETDKKFQETREQMKETDKKIKELAELFTGQWGKLVESLVAPGCLKLFQERGIKILQCFPNFTVQKNGRQMEIDLMLVNDTELVVIEIKTTARVKHIKELLKELAEFRQFFPRYADCRIYGAIAALRYQENCDSLAADQGLFVIKATGEGLVKITNPQKFAPKAF